MLKPNQIFNLHCNLQRIGEMDKAGLSHETISMVLKDAKINVSAREVSMLVDIIPEIARNRVTKKVTNLAINTITDSRIYNPA